MAKLTKDEIEFVRENSKSMSAKDIGKALRRTEKTVKDVQKLFEHEIAADVSKQQMKEDLYRKYYWPTIKTQFSPAELVFFSDMWVNLLNQFSDLMETEEHQVVDYIRFEILKNRNLTERGRASNRVVEIQGEMERFINKYGPPPYDDDDEAEDWRRLNDETNSHTESYHSRTEEFKKLQERQEALRKTLKANREDRIKQNMDSRYSFQDFIKMLLEEKYRNEQGRMLAIMKEAAEKERKRLSEYHQYADNVIDIPILNSETTEEEDNQEQEKQEYEYEE